jgi:uncharacterized membrane-anchored protein
MSTIVRALTMRTLRKVPEVTIYFWIIKLLTTALGESTSDYLVHHIDPYVAVSMGLVAFALALALQLLARRYVAWVYWLAVTMVAIFGTMAADVVHIVLGVPYIISSIGFAIALVMIFVLWSATERTLSIHSINTPRRELFYWATVVATFALGTATGDLTAFTFRLGFFVSGIVFIVVFAIPFLLRMAGLNEILTFWWAYILTRPIGASFADWTGRAPSTGGIGLGNGPVSLVLTLLIIGFVVFLSATRIDVAREPQAAPGERYRVEPSRL